MEKYQTKILISLKFYGINIELAAHYIGDKNVVNTIVVESCTHDDDKILIYEDIDKAQKRFKELISGEIIKGGFFKSL